MVFRKKKQIVMEQPEEESEEPEEPIEEEEEEEEVEVKVVKKKKSPTEKTQIGAPSASEIADMIEGNLARNYRLFQLLRQNSSI